MSIEIKGRPKRQYLIEVKARKGYLQIRLDDAKESEFWQEINIPHHELLALVAQVHRLTYAPDFIEELPEIDDVARSFGLHPVEPDTLPPSSGSTTIRPKG